MYKKYSKIKEREYKLKQLKNALDKAENQLLEGIEIILNVFHECTDDLEAMEQACNDYCEFLNLHCRNMYDYYCLKHPIIEHKRKRKYIYDRKI